MRKIKMKMGLLACACLLVLAACGTKGSSEQEPNDLLKVYTTVYPLQYFTEQIGGEYVDVQSIYPTGADEHIFEPTQKDMISLAKSDLFFYIGLGLEGFVENAEKTLKNEQVKMVATAANISTDRLEEGRDHDDEGHEEGDHESDAHEHDHGQFDPHVWISPILSIDLASSIKDALIEKDPAHEADFQANYDALANKLKALDTQFKEMAAMVPNKTFFVSHAAFGYIADTYGFEQVAIAGLNSQSEPSQKQLAKIVAEAKSKNVKYVLFEQNVSSKLTDVVRKEIGADSLILHNLGVLTPDDVKNNETYFTLMQHNIEVLRTALGG
ncbi:metal ABC transporter solute-binding protein, Zn/Mn family [Sporosarcina sp. HYO08]|uniref:metal ABC transporter solute-binding protein, Zn/Mn family n=1 Tax=Sporosarcina sp. HYO08 TaxID=1759557 RepID=UPI0007960C23|nr:zinc ABC transporter substrate-binding protein [Sporosarcina sp. HYO08]KXH86904.1 adhesin [Sporosarcina sp. HYO08]